MKRRGFIAVLAALPALAVSLVKPPSVFADKVRPSLCKWNGNLQPHTERHATAVMPYRMLEDPVAFHQQAEEVRLAMIEALHREGAPINVWRVGQMNGGSASPIDFCTGESRPWIDEHSFRVRTRVSVEYEPRQWVEGRDSYEMARRLAAERGY